MIDRTLYKIFVELFPTMQEKFVKWKAVNKNTLELDMVDYGKLIFAYYRKGDWDLHPKRR